MVWTRVCPPDSLGRIEIAIPFEDTIVINNAYEYELLVPEIKVTETRLRYKAQRKDERIGSALTLGGTGAISISSPPEISGASALFVDGYPITFEGKFPCIRNGSIYFYYYQGKNDWSYVDDYNTSFGELEYYSLISVNNDFDFPNRNLIPSRYFSPDGTDCKLIPTVTPWEEWSIKVRDKEKMLLDRSLIRIPTVYTSCVVTNVCPENTCEVICGDTICCYGSDGISVDSFPVTVKKYEVS